jgi:hypothetical protein
MGALIRKLRLFEDIFNETEVFLKNPRLLKLFPEIWRLFSIM